MIEFDILSMMILSSFSVGIKTCFLALIGGRVLVPLKGFFITIYLLSKNEKNVEHEDIVARIVAFDKSKSFNEILPLARKAKLSDSRGVSSAKLCLPFGTLEVWQKYLYYFLLCKLPV